MKKKKRVVWIWYIGKNVFQVSNRKIHIKLTDDDEIVKFVEA